MSAASEPPDEPVGASGEVPSPLPAVVPPVVAVLVTHDPGDWFDETLQSLADQTYADLGVLVIDTGSDDDPTERIRAVLPDAHVEVLDHDPGYSAAANRVRELVEGASFYLFCHDDVALEPDTLRSLVEEAFRSNAGIIGPKLVDWNTPRRLLQVGMGADKTGVLVPLNDHGELDQEQHDAVRDVFVVPGGCSLVRADLFDALGGYDEGIDLLGEDLDLCWRAHVVGARVMIGPSTRVRHLEALGERHPVDDRRRRFARHRLRTSLIAYGTWHRLRVLPQAFFFTLVEALYGVLAGHPEQSRDVLSAWPWNIRRWGQIRARRSALQSVRRVDDGEIRAMQVSGSARTSGFVRGRLGRRDDRVTTFARSSRDIAGAVRAGSRQLTGTFAIVLTVLLVLSSRDLVFGGIPAVGELARFPDSPGTFADAWWTGWRRAGLGAEGAQPTGYGILAVLGYVFLGAMGVLRSVLILATIPLGALGAWRVARPIGSARASVAAFAVYLAIPVPYNALARGSLSGLLAYAASPWILLSLGRASGLAPFGPRGADDDGPVRSQRGLAGIVMGLGILLAFVAAFVPVVVAVAVAVGLALSLGSLFCFRVAGVPRLLAACLGSAALAVVLHLPWSLDLITAPSPWEAVAGISATSGGPLTLGRVLRFETGPWGAPPLGWAFLLAGALPVVLGRSWRLEWAVRAWFVVLAGWGVLWASQDGHLSFGLPAAEVVLAPVAAALALAAALGLAAFEIDLRAYRFGWRQVLSVAAALGVVLGAAPLASGLLDGRWRMPNRAFSTALDPLVDGRGDPPFRVLWVGDADVLPASGWRLDEDLAYATTDRGVPTMLDRFPGPPPGATPLIAEVLDVAAERRTNRLGHLLAPMGIRYLVIPSRLAPSTTAVTGQRPPPPELIDTLAQQLDLEEVPVSEGLLVYRNSAWTPTRSVLPDREGDRATVASAVTDELAGSEPALVRDRGGSGAVGEVPATGDLLVASSSDPGWELRIGGVPMARTETYGWANQFEATRTGPGELTFDTPIVRTLATASQLGVWALVLWVHRRTRRRERRAAERVAPVGSRGEVDG